MTSQLIANSWSYNYCACIILNRSVWVSGERTSKNPSDWKVGIGEHSLLRNEGREIMQGVRQILIHPDYKPSNSSHPGNNDIGISTSSYRDLD